MTWLRRESLVKLRSEEEEEEEEENGKKNIKHLHMDYGHTLKHLVTVITTASR